MIAPENMKKTHNKDYNLFSKVPLEIGIFAHDRALILPGTEISLNIFEERYIDLILDAIEINNRYLGIITPIPRNLNDAIGCLAKIISFTENPDNKLNITIQGVTRFKVNKIIKTDLKYKVIEPEYDDFITDYKIIETKFSDRTKINDMILKYIELNEGNKLEPEKISTIPDTKIFSFLCNNIDFPNEDRKKLMEAKDFEEIEFLVENATNIAIANSESKNMIKH